jgi:uncharacterized protein YecE (DUF72 family)
LTYIGTSGWTYKHWKERFYPKNLKQKEWLEYYAAKFRTVEINATFYHIPKVSTSEGWNNRTPLDFRFAVKVSRLITHVHKLHNCQDIVDWFFRSLKPLKQKVLAFLFQFPKSFCPSEEVLQSFIKQLPPLYRYIFEFRNQKAYSKDIIDLLKANCLGFCIHDFPQCEAPENITSEIVYLRFHGYGSQYGGSYPEDILEHWADKIMQWKNKGKIVLVYFNNDAEGFAVQNAFSLKSHIDRLTL